MKQVALLVTLLFVPLLAEIIPGTTVPSLLWSNMPFFSGVNTQANTVNSAQELASTLLRTRSKGNSLSKYLIEGSLPEVIVIYVEPHLHTEEIPRLTSFSQASALPNLEKLMTSSHSSLTVPYGTPVSSVFGTNVVNEVISQLPMKSKIIIASSSDAVSAPSRKNVEVISIAELENRASSNWEIFNNKETDLVVVYLSAPKFSSEGNNDAYSADDALVGRLHESFKSTSFVSIFTANKDEGRDSLVLPAAGEGIQKFNERFSQKVENSNWPDDVLAGLYVSAFVLLIVFLGICCNLGIQSTLRFEGTDKAGITIVERN